MKINIDHPSFISFLNTITNNILTSVSIENYFKLSSERKLNIQYVVFKLMKNAVRVRAKLSDTELRSFVIILWNKNEQQENYEIAAILNDINNNFDSINEFTKVKKRIIKPKIEIN